MQEIQTSNAELCRTMQKEEWVNTILIEVTLNPKITNKQLVEKYHCNRNTVSKYRKIIRQRQLKTDTEIINKIDGILEDRLLEMEDRDLISYRKAIHQEVNVKSEMNIKEKILHATIDLTKMSENDRKAIFNAEEALTRTEKTVC